MPAIDRVEVERPRLQVLASGESQQLLGQLGAVLGGALRRRQVPGRDRVARRPRLQQLEIADDRGQQIVEVVRDAAGQMADGLHLLGLAQLLLHRFPGGQVARRRHDEPVALVLLRHPDEHHVDRAA